MKLTKKEIFSIPNLLSYFRLLLIPVFAYLFLRAETPIETLIAAVVLGISSLTDCFDGLIARKCNMVTELGKALDPIADKLTHFAIALCLTIKIPATFPLLVLVVVKELFMGIAGLVILKKTGRKLDGAKWFGKLSTLVFDLAMIALILFAPFLPEAVIYLILLISGGFLLFSFCMYVPVFVQLYRGE